MDWISFEHSTQLEELLQTSEEKGKYDLIFKHSTRCPISSMALNRLERFWDLDDQLVPYYLDLIKHRDLSNEVARRLNIMHESPQIILLKNGEVMYHSSHNAINVEGIKEYLAQSMHSK